MSMEIRANAPAVSKIRIIAYWLTTAIIVLETGVGAYWDIARIPFVNAVLQHLGYPLYLLTIIGVWKVFAVVALLIPGYPRTKEWAYAGVFFVYTTAAASHITVGDLNGAWGPVIFAGIVLTSRALRPASRRMALTQVSAAGSGDKNTVKKKRQVAGYWITIVLLAFVLLSSGVAEMMHFSGNVEGIVHGLGYPMYFLSIQGAWKILGGIALLVPGFAVLKEWAYAGIVFNMTGAAASSAFCGYGGMHLVAPLIIAGIAVLSWFLRPR